MAPGGEWAGRALGVALVLLLAVGCTGSDGERGTPSTTTSPGVTGGTVRLGIGGPLVVDPVKASLASPSQLMVLDLLHDGLTRLGADGAARPALATSWVANDAFTAFRFHLDPDATFVSGRAITADDVIASLERVMAAGEGSLGALSLEPVTGFAAFVDGDAEHVSGLSAPDARTIRVALDTPLAVLPVVLSNPVLGVVDVAAVTGDHLADLDVSGLWAVASADGGSVLLEPREAAKVALDGVALDLFDDEEAAYDAFDAGTVDWAVVPASRHAQALADHGDGAFAPFHAELFFGLNLRSPNLDDAGLRSAIAMAIDRDAIVEAVYPDLADPLSTVVPAGVPGHDPKRCPTCGFDPAAATDAVEEAFPEGDVPVVHVDFDESDPQRAMAELVAADLEAVGIPAELRPKPRDDYEAFVVSGEQELFSFGWIGAYGSPDAYLSPLFGSAANDNLTGLRSERVDLLLVAARLGDDAPEAAELWASAEAMVLETAVVVPIAQFRTQVVVADRVEGLAHAVDGTVDWTMVRLRG